MRSGLRNFITNFGSKIMMVLFGLASQSIIARMLGPSGRGSYAVALLFANILTMLFVVGTDTAGRYYVLNRRFTLSEGVTHILVCGLLGCVLSIGVGLLIMKFPLSFLTKSSPLCFYLSLATIPLSLFSYAFLTLLAANDKFGWYFLIGAGSSFLGLILNIVFLWFLRLGVAGVIMALSVNQAVTIVVVLMVLRIKYGLKLARPTWQGVIDMFSYGGRYYVGKISNKVNFQIGNIILAFFASQADIGLFSLAVGITSYIMLIPDSLGDIMMPRIAADLRGKPELTAQACRMVGLITGSALLILVLFAKPIIILLFSRAFEPMVPILQIVTVGFFFRSACKMIEYYFLMTNRPGVSSTATAIGVAVNLFLMWWLLPIMGLFGAAISMSISYIISSLILVLLYCRKTGTGFTELCCQRRTDWQLLSESARRLYVKLNGQVP